MTKIILKLKGTWLKLKIKLSFKFERKKKLSPPNKDMMTKAIIILACILALIFSESRNHIFDLLNYIQLG